MLVVSHLRSALLFLPMEGERPRSVITSADPNEGKSTVAATWPAPPLGHGGSRVLLVMPIPKGPSP